MSEAVVINNASVQAQQSVGIEMFERWVQYVDASPKTVQTYTKAIKQFMLYLATNGISQPKREDIIAYREYLTKGHKPTTVQSYLAAVKLFFQWTERENLYPNVADHVKGATLDREHKKDYMSTKQVNRLLSGVDQSTLQGARDYAILSLMVTTGLRTVSIVAANIEDIRTVGDDSVLYYKGKGHDEKAKYVKLAEPVEDAILNYLKLRGKSAGESPLFASVSNKNSGQRMTTRSISRIVKTHLEESGLISDRLTAHSLRHTAATLNLKNGGTLEETKQLLDHADINTTLIYVHAMEREDNNSEKRIAKAIFG